MSYTQTALKGTNESVNLEKAQKGIGSLTFNLIWSGSASTALTSALSNITNKLNAERAKLSGFFNALSLLDQYKQNKESIAKLKFQLMCIPDHEKYAAERAAIQAQISQLEQENQALRSQINTIISQITPLGSSTTLVAHNVEFNYVTGVEELLNKYNGLTEEEKAAGIRLLSQLKGSARLDSYYNSVDENGNVIEGSGFQYITSVLDTIKNTYSGREAAVNTALVLLKLASDKGVKLDYKHQGTMGSNPYVSTKDVLNGVDCNPWTSYCVDKGTPDRFQWRPVTGFFSVGTGIPYENWSQAQPGDVMVSEGHVGIIIENDPDNNRFVVAEAKGTNIGIVLNYRGYGELRGGGYSIRDMTDVYNGTENTDREVFNEIAEANKTTI